ncbi:MAG: hypothetical protein MUE96_06860 [Bacteroidia bacterium]|jgi:hypothetical protein|nr:hypothetical protein [Bacteroidia bacterium]
MRFFKHTVYLLLFLGLQLGALAQTEEAYKEPLGLNNWYIELGGAGLFYSLNYEKILIRTEKWGWVGRVGLGYNPVDYTLLNKVTLEGNTIMAPFHTSVLYGPNKEKLEVGGGFTLLAQNINQREVVPTFVFGFRVLETNKVCFRATYTPYIQNGQWENWFGVSLGRNFSTGKKR